MLMKIIEQSCVIGMNKGVIWLQGQGTIIAFPSFRISLGFTQQIGAIVMRAGEIRPGGDGLVKTLQRFRLLLQLLMGDAEVG